MRLSFQAIDILKQDKEGQGFIVLYKKQRGMKIGLVSFMMRIITAINF